MLEPRSVKVIDGESAVFATNTRWLAILFIASDATNVDIQSGFIGGIPYILEQYPGAFNKFLKGRSGYLHYVNSKYFKKDKRLGMYNHEFISYNKVPVLKIIKIQDIYEELKKENVNILSFQDYEEMLFNKLNKKNNQFN